MTGTADISPCGRYRYRLSRTWGDPTGPRVAWVMLNPSTADAAKDDATIRKIIRMTRAREAVTYAGLDVVNLFALRATNPAALLDVSREEAVGAGNDEHIAEVCRAADRVVFAWGDGPRNGGEAAKRFIDGRGASVKYAVRSVICGPAYHFGMNTLRGNPRHPLYMKDAEKWVPAIF